MYALRGFLVLPVLIIGVFRWVYEEYHVFGCSGSNVFLSSGCRGSPLTGAAEAAPLRPRARVVLGGRHLRE